MALVRRGELEGDCHPTPRDAHAGLAAEREVVPVRQQGEVAIARGFLIPTGVDISCAPTFSDVEIGGESRTAIRIAVYVDRLAAPGTAAATEDMEA